MSQATGSVRETEVRRCQPVPCPQGSVAWEAWDQQLAADDVARGVVEALPSLDLGPLWQSYSGRGSLPYSPELLWALVLVEQQRGRASPSPWHRDQRDSVALLWVGQGIQPARSVWYDFRDRLAPFLDGWNEQVLRRAIPRRLTDGSDAATDGTRIAACASRQRWMNHSQITSRGEQLDAACAQDTRSEPVEKKVSGWPARLAAALSNGTATGARTSCCSRVWRRTRARAPPSAGRRSAW